MKPKSQENTHSEGYKNYEAEDKAGDHGSKAETHSSTQHNKPDLLSGISEDEGKAKNH